MAEYFLPAASGNVGSPWKIPFEKTVCSLREAIGDGVESYPRVKICVVPYKTQPF
jgi:hypothetical protein